MKDVIYSEVSLNNYMIIKNIRESLLPDVNNVSLKLNGHVGSKFIKQELGTRRIDIDVEILADSRSERQELVNIVTPLLYTEREEELILGERRVFKAVLDGSTPIENIVHDGMITLSFIAHDPIAYSRYMVRANFNSTTRMYNKGNYKTIGVIDLKATRSTMKVSLGGGEEYDYIEMYNLRSGDNVEIDLGNERVTVNGDPHIKDIDPLGDYFNIPPGEFSVDVSGGTGATLLFRERWI